MKNEQISVSRQSTKVNRAIDDHDRSIQLETQYPEYERTLISKLLDLTEITERSIIRVTIPRISNPNSFQQVINHECILSNR